MGGANASPVIMTAISATKSEGAALFAALRLWSLPLLTAALILINAFWFNMDSAQMTMIAAAAIVIAGIPHGTLDVEIAASHFGQANGIGKSKIISGYVACVLLMLIFWAHLPPLALISFLTISIVHFGRDWRGGADPFLAMMVGWALVALPALSHPQAVSSIFEMLTNTQGGGAIAAALACTSVPAALGSIVFAYCAYQRDEKTTAAEVITCLIAALFLPPLVALAIFFCGLHSPRHMADAMREAGTIAPIKKALIIAAVFALSMGLGVLVFIDHGEPSIETGVIRAAFVLISTLTVPHFIMEQIMSAQKTKA